MTSRQQVTDRPERGRAIATLTAAFIADPVLRWVFPEAHQYMRAFPRLVEAFAGKSFETNSAYSLAEPVAVALWLGPGLESDGEAMEALIADTVSEHLMEDLGGFVEKMAALHPRETHWYLPLMGVDPFYQRRGLGSKLLEHALSVCDKDKLPAYLEATSENNRRLYERHGFAVMGEVQHGSSPTMWAMWRAPN